MFHLNPNTGEPSRCVAQKENCPYGSDAPHFEEKKEAREFYEKNNESFTASAHRKIATSVTKFGAKVYSELSPEEEKEVAQMYDSSKISFDASTKEFLAAEKALFSAGDFFNRKERKAVLEASERVFQDIAAINRIFQLHNRGSLKNYDEIAKELRYMKHTAADRVARIARSHPGFKKELLMFADGYTGKEVRRALIF